MSKLRKLLLRAVWVGLSIKIMAGHSAQHRLHKGGEPACFFLSAVKAQERFFFHTEERLQPKRGHAVKSAQ